MLTRGREGALGKVSEKQFMQAISEKFFYTFFRKKYIPLKISPNQILLSTVILITTVKIVKHSNILQTLFFWLVGLEHAPAWLGVE